MIPEARLAAALRVTESLAADALLVLGRINIRYLSGFTGSDSALLLADSGCNLLCDSRYTLQASAEAPLCQVSEYKVKLDGIAALITGRGWRRVAFDAEQVPVSFFNSLSNLLAGVEFIALADQLDQLRAVKSSDEIDRIAFSAGLASAAFEELLPQIMPGVSERELAFKLEMLLKGKGADDKAFDFIVVSGERGALPHGRPTERILRSEEMVTIDFGGCCQGYHSDETVTLAIGKPASRLLEAYNVVKEAHDLAIRAVRPGIGCREIDFIARDYIASHGFAEFFGHGLGHGVGLEVHEKPMLSSRSSQIVVEGMIFTIEPGIYIPDLGGVRIEDLVQVTSDGCRVLSKVSKELTIC